MRVAQLVPIGKPKVCLYNLEANLMKILSKTYILRLPTLPTYFDTTKVYIGFGVQKSRTRFFRFSEERNLPLKISLN